MIDYCVAQRTVQRSDGLAIRRGRANACWSPVTPRAHHVTSSLPVPTRLHRLTAPCWWRVTSPTVNAEQPSYSSHSQITRKPTSFDRYSGTL